MLVAARTASDVHARDVWFAHADRPVLRGVDLIAPAGAVTALRGDNGAGKSTLLDVLCGVRRPDRGEVLRPSPVAYVPQRTTVDARLPVTVREVVSMGTWTHRGAWRRLRAIDRAAVQAAMERVHIDHLARRRLDELSGGQVQRTLTARALTTEAPVIVLDEPTTGLDREVRADLLTLLKELAGEGRVVLHATHDDDALAASDTVLTLAHGTIECDRGTRQRSETR